MFHFLHNGAPLSVLHPQLDPNNKSGDTRPIEITSPLQENEMEHNFDENIMILLIQISNALLLLLLFFL